MLTLLKDHWLRESKRKARVFALISCRIDNNQEIYFCWYFLQNRQQSTESSLEKSTGSLSLLHWYCVQVKLFVFMIFASAALLLAFHIWVFFFESSSPCWISHFTTYIIPFLSLIYYLLNSCFFLNFLITNILRTVS
jgi:hypothetical protein